MAEIEEVVIDTQRQEWREKAQCLLEEGGLLNYADKYFNHFIVKEEANRKVLYLALLNKNQILIRGESSQGKTWLAKNVLRAIPENRWDAAGGFSEASPKYYFESLGQDIDIIFVPEFEGRPEQNHVFRFSSVDDGGGRFVVSEYDQESKRWHPRVIETGVKTLLSTSVHIDIDRQDISRSWELYPDPSEKQTEDICKQQANDFVNGDQKKDYFFEQMVLWEAYEDLRKQDFEVVCPFYRIGEILEMPFNSWFMRRENKRIIGLISNLARINYKRRVTYSLFQEVKGEFKEVHYLIADLEDIILALRLLNDINAGVSTGLTPTENKMLELIFFMTEDKDDFASRVGTEQVLLAMQESGWAIESQDYVAQILNGLFKKGFVFKQENPHDRRSNLYSLTKKRRDFVKIHYENIEPCFTAWLNNRCEDAFSEITQHPRYPELLAKSVIPKEDISDLLFKKEADKKEIIASSEDTRQKLATSYYSNEQEKLPSSEEIPSFESLANSEAGEGLKTEKKDGEPLEKNYLVASNTEVSRIELLLSIISELVVTCKDKSKKAAYQDILKEAAKLGIDADFVEKNLQRMRIAGTVIEIVPGYWIRS